MSACEWCGVPHSRTRSEFCTRQCQRRSWRAAQSDEWRAQNTSRASAWYLERVPAPDVESLEGESWRPVLGYEGLYEVSDIGRVKSLYRAAGRRARILRQHIRRHQYLSVRLYQQDGSSHRMTVHRLVLEAFGGLCPPGRECCHRDGDAQNNRPENLYWGTHAQNMQDRARHQRERTAA